MSSKRRIPRDTLGHPLPPPVRAEHVCRIPKSKWGEWWVRFYDDLLEKELDCSVCGLSFPEITLTPLDRALIESKVQEKVLNTTASQVRLCRACKAACDRCRKVIITEQKRKFNGICQACIEEERQTQRKGKAPYRS